MSKAPTPRKGSTLVAKSQSGQQPFRKAARSPAPVAYCGPTIPGKAVQFTTYTNGLSSPLLEAVQASPVLKALVVPLDQLPEVRRQLQARAGRYYTLYCKAQEIC